MKWHHAGLYVNDMAAAEIFYQSVFHFQIERRFTWNHEQITFLVNKDVRVELIMANQPVPVTKGIHLSWQVENLEAMMKKLRCHGMMPCEGPFHLTNGWKTVFYEGVNGETIELIELK
jgi:lactoylglutathione lyase/glyoxylase I family protein